MRAGADAACRAVGARLRAEVVQMSDGRRVAEEGPRVTIVQAGE